MPRSTRVLPRGEQPKAGRTRSLAGTQTVSLPHETSKPDHDHDPESGLKTKLNTLSPLNPQIPQRDGNAMKLKASMVLRRIAKKPKPSLGSSITSDELVTIDPGLEFSGPQASPPTPVRKEWI